jgi:hypothetical protein
MVSLELYSLGQLNSVLAPNHLLLDMMLDVVNNNKNCELCLMYVCSPYKWVTGKVHKDKKGVFMGILGEKGSCPSPSAVSSPKGRVDSLLPVPRFEQETKLSSFLIRQRLPG